MDSFSDHKDDERDLEYFISIFANSSAEVEKHFVALKAIVRRFFFTSETIDGRLQYKEKIGDPISKLQQNHVKILLKWYDLGTSSDYPGWNDLLATHAKKSVPRRYACCASSVEAHTG